MVSDQDNGLDELSKIISRQKDIAVKIGSEADTQNGMYIILSIFTIKTLRSLGSN